MLFKVSVLGAISFLWPIVNAIAPGASVPGPNNFQPGSFTLVQVNELLRRWDEMLEARRSEGKLPAEVKNIMPFHVFACGGYHLLALADRLKIPVRNTVKDFDYLLESAIYGPSDMVYFADENSQLHGEIIFFNAQLVGEDLHIGGWADRTLESMAMLQGLDKILAKSRQQDIVLWPGKALIVYAVDIDYMISSQQDVVTKHYAHTKNTGDLTALREIQGRLGRLNKGIEGWKLDSIKPEII